MEHFYDKIDGWFDFPNIYTEMVNKFDSGSYFVEIGSWLGRSTSYMAVEIINSGKDIKFDCIDGWEGSVEHKDNTYVINKTLYEEFLKNVEPVLDHINPIKGFSYDVVNNYQDNSIDFLFIDGAHDYESVKKDLIDWYPKVKKNGVIAGHDYNVGNFPGLVTAVNEFFNNENIIRNGWSWIVDKTIYRNINFDISYDKNINKTYIYCNSDIEVTIIFYSWTSLINNETVIYTEVSHFNNNKFWYSFRNLNALSGLKVEIHYKNRIIKEQYFDFKNN